MRSYGAVSAAMSVLCVFAKCAIYGAGMCSLVHQTLGFIIFLNCWTFFFFLNVVCPVTLCYSLPAPPPPRPNRWAHQSLPSNTRQEGVSIWVATEDVNCCENERKQSPSRDASQCLLHKRPAERWGLLAKSDLALIGWQTGLPRGRDACTYAGVDRISADAIGKQTHSSWKLKC